MARLAFTLLDTKMAGQRRQGAELERSYGSWLFPKKIRHLLGGVIQHTAVQHHRALFFCQATERAGYRSPALTRRDNGEWIVFVVGRVRFCRWRHLVLDAGTYVLSSEVLRDFAARDAQHPGRKRKLLTRTGAANVFHHRIECVGSEVLGQMRIVDTCQHIAIDHR